MPINGQETRDELLTQKKGLLREIDQLQTQAFTQADQLRQMKEIIEDKEYSEKLRGWSIDRALEIFRVNGGKPETKDVFAVAQEFLVWVKTPAPEIKPKDAETMQ